MITNSNNQPAEKVNTSHKFARNAFFNVTGFVVTFPIILILTPYMLKVLGKTQFGIWAIAGVVTSYAQLSEMGMTTAIVKIVAGHWGKREIDRISKVVSTALFSFAVIGGIVVITILLTCNFIAVSILKVPPDLQNEVIFVITWVIIIFYFNIVFSVFNSILQGIQRMDITNSIMVVSKILNAICLWIFLAAGFGLKGLILNSAIFSTLTILVNIFWVKRLIRGIKVNLLLFSFSEVRRVLKYSINIFISNLMGLGQDPLNKIILAAYTSLSFVSFYEIGCRVKQMAGQLFGMAIMPLLPASADLHSAAKHQEMERIYLSVSRMFYLFAVPAFLLVIVLAEPLVLVWLGKGYEKAAHAIQFLLLANLFSLMVMPQYIMLQGIGKPHLCTLVAGINGVTNIVLAIILGHVIGYYGVLSAVVISLAFASLIMMYLFHRETGFSVIAYIQSLPLHMMAIGGIFLVGLRIIAHNIIHWEMSNFLGIVLGSSIAYLVITFWLLDKDDRALFKRITFAVLRRNALFEKS